MRTLDRSIYATAVSSFLGFLAPLVYGLLTRLVFKSSPWSDWFSLVTLGFLFGVPFALGALTVFFASASMRTNWLYGLLAPWASCLICVTVIGVLTWEAWICIVMALPISLFMSSLGGALFCLIFTIRNQLSKAPSGLLALVLVAPYIFTSLENRLPASDSIRTVESSIVIYADAETIWYNIIRLAEINDTERPFSLFHLAGLPRPREALLSHEGVGGIRSGQWEDGLVFVGTITEWEPDKGFTVRLEADTRAISSPLPLEEIGGSYFDMVDDSYVIEPTEDGRVILHLLSTYRLTTHFNSYGVLWIDFFLHDIQNHILRVVKTRAESQP